MRRTLAALVLAAALAPVPALARNVVVFIADGLRYDSVTPEIAPTLWKLRADGVDFTNSHSLYPTVTTANASAIATGHYLGDTGNYANTLFVGFPVPCRQNLSLIFLENDCILGDVKKHFGDGYIGQTTLVQAARAAGYNTYVFGKTGPAAIQDLDTLSGKSFLIDEFTNKPTNPDGSPTGGPVLTGTTASIVATATGLAASPGTSLPNVVQQAYQTSAADAILTQAARAPDKKPFVLVYWSRDPDYSQHNADDSTGRIVPGINSTTQHRGITNADNALKALLDTLKRNGLDKDTDIFVTADHGFITVAQGLPDASGAVTPGTYLPGFVAYDVAKWLGGEKIFDPDKNNAALNTAANERSTNGSGIVGPSADKPRVIVVANSGSDFIHVPGNDLATMRTLFDGLTRAPYTAALFVNDAILKGHEAEFKGALPMSAINLIGAGGTPQPSIVVGFRSFVAAGCKLGTLLCTAALSDGARPMGQGNHGGSSRAETRNFMAAIGPSFKAKFKSRAPVSNADITPTMAHILGLSIAPKGDLAGRVAGEALKGGAATPFTPKVLRSEKAESGFQTILQYQEADGRRYFDAVGMPGRVVGLTAK